MFEFEICARAKAKMTCMEKRLRYMKTRLRYMKKRYRYIYKRLRYIQKATSPHVASVLAPGTTNQYRY
jgi:hypothetical protein